MSMISRYQKSGGFFQLLKLIETCNKQKQDNFIQIIQKEDPRWAFAIQQKMLSFEKIMSWDDNTLAEIFSRVNELTLAAALPGLDDAQWERISKTFSHSQKRRIDDLKNSRTSNAADVSTAIVKIIEEVRQMIKDGHLRADKFAPEVLVEENIEEKLNKGEIGTVLSLTETSPPSIVTEKSETTSRSTVASSSMAANSHSQLEAEVANLKNKVQFLITENNQLKLELKGTKEKLEQIKKFVA